MVTREQVEAVLGRVRPFLQIQGGDIEVVGDERRTPSIRLTGSGQGSSRRLMTLHDGIATALRQAIRGLKIARLH